MSATQDYVALDWIKAEISQTLEQAQHALEAVAASAADTSSMRACLTAIHQVHGTLKMVQLDGPMQIAAEMEELAQGLLGESIADVPLAQETLMQSILQMPAYLNRIQREQQDSPAFVGLLVNELRVARGEAPLAFGAAVSAAKAMSDWFVQEPDVTDQTAFDAGHGADAVKKLRQHYQQALHALLKKQDPRANLNLLGKVFARLEKLCGQSAMANLFQLGLAVVEGISAGAIRLDGALANELKAIDGELKRLGEFGASVLGKTSADLGLGLLARLKDASKTTPRIVAAKAKFLQGDDVAVAPASNSNVGPDADTMAAVANILLEEFTGIIDKLDLYVRSGSRSKQLIVDLVPALKQFASTLSVVGLAEHQQTVLLQIQLIEQIQAQAEDAHDEQLIELARAFLQIEASLRNVSGTAEDAADSFGDLNEAQASVLRETRNGLAQARDVIVDFVMTEFDQSKLEGIVVNLHNLRGGLSMVNQDRSGNVLLACAAYIDGQLVGASTPPGLDALDDLADAMTSVDYYLERLLENATDPYLQMLEVAEAAVAKLGYAVAAVLAQQRQPKAEVPPPAGAAEDLVDDEILEIFAEEAAEVLTTINEYYPRWRADRQDKSPLVEIRRAFHTLKGSGRMVGATVMGEFAWAVEKLLNGLLDGTVAVSDDIFLLLDRVVSRIPEGLAAFEAQQQETFDVIDLIRQAQAWAAGEVPAAEADLTERESVPIGAAMLRTASDAGESPDATEMDFPEAAALEFSGPAEALPIVKGNLLESNLQEEILQQGSLPPPDVQADKFWQAAAEDAELRAEPA
ncbi:MAG: Hpt domain-containing protein, partial [Pseudomonadales bacterium]|nr:Hpt domain-containing protein [Pseudomonadales bacterium]